MEPDGDRPGTTGYMSGSAGTSLLSDHASRRAAAGVVDCEHEHAGHDLDQNKLTGIREIRECLTR
jgi:hypothetical protein